MLPEIQNRGAIPSVNRCVTAPWCGRTHSFLRTGRQEAANGSAPDGRRVGTIPPAERPQPARHSPETGCKKSVCHMPDKKTLRFTRERTKVIVYNTTTPAASATTECARKGRKNHPAPKNCNLTFITRNNRSRASRRAVRFHNTIPFLDLR